MKEKTGAVFSIAKDNQPVAGCTISKEVYASGQDWVKADGRFKMALLITFE